MALNTQKWLSTFQEQLYPNNTFYFGTMNDSAYVTNKTVSIPNYQEEVTVFDMNGATGSYPRTLKELTHVEKVYSMIQPAVDPYMVDPVEDNEFAYDKRKSVLDQAVNKLSDYVAFKILWDWTVIDAGSIVSSTSTTTRLNRFGNTVKKITFADIQGMATKLNLQNVPRAGRRLVVDSYGLEDIQNMPELQGSQTLTNQAFTDGAIMRVAGFDVYERSQTVGLTSAGAKKAIGAADVATDLATAVAYHPSMVRYAVGTKTNSGIKVIIGAEDPAIYGQALSAYTRVGGSTSYLVDASNIVKGVVTLKESV